MAESPPAGGLSAFKGMIHAALTAARRALAVCHRALESVDVPLAPWTKLAEARSRRPEFAPWLAPPDVPLRPIHGDAHAGNVLPGPVWHDWEDAQLGCVEWDLACLVAPGRDSIPGLSERNAVRLEWLRSRR
jgi:aminoglycoside phosphotransferase (APT) family kinase protein